MLDFTTEETRMLVEDGFEAGFIGDIQEGDLVAIAPVSRSRLDGTPIPVKTLVVQRIMKVDSSYHQEDTNEIVYNVVINFIGVNLENLPEHCAYGHTYPCFIKRDV